VESIAGKRVIQASYVLSEMTLGFVKVNLFSNETHIVRRKNQTESSALHINPPSTLILFQSLRAGGIGGDMRPSRRVHAGSTMRFLDF